VIPHYKFNIMLVYTQHNSRIIQPTITKVSCMCTSRTLTPRKQKPKKHISRPSQKKIKGDCKFNMFHIHALNDNAIYTIKQTMYVCELYLSHVIHHRYISTCHCQNLGNLQDYKEPKQTVKMHSLLQSMSQTFHIVIEYQLQFL
jgi:hypothetical protein